MKDLHFTVLGVQVKLLVITLLYFSLPSQAVAQGTHYKNFSNITINAEASTIYSFAQDNQGLIWLGTNKGLFSYDAYTNQPHFTYGEVNHTAIYTMLEHDGTYLFLGTDNGLLLYNYKTDKYEPLEINGLCHVRALAKERNIIWIGSLNGFYKYDIETGEIEDFTNNGEIGLPHHTIYSIISCTDKNLYIGTYDGLCRYNSQTNILDRIVLPSSSKRNNQFINTLLEDTTTNTIWIGTEGALYTYSIDNNEIKEVSIFQNNSIKSLSLDDSKNLLLATDNGLYIYNPENESYQHVVHDSRDSNSLSNNIVWSLFRDAEKNIWIGTDYGVSLSRYNQLMQTLPIAELTGIGVGNRFHAIHKDAKGNFWFGGTNGLILSSSLQHKAKWYRMVDPKYPISHNRIRHIYEDSDHNLWVATDGSINRYDYNRQQFVNYAIVDSTETLNSNWAYYIFEDASNKLWIATCLGGVFVVDKERLLKSSGTYIAEQSYSTSNGLPDDFVNQIVQDGEGNVWVLLYNKGICKINTYTGGIVPIAIGSDTQPNFIIADEKGSIWAAIRGGIVHIDPKTKRSKTIKIDLFNNDEILALLEVEDNIWISTTEGVWLLNKDNQTIRRLNISNKQYTSMYYDVSSRNVYMGALNTIAIIAESAGKEVETQSKLVLTNLLVNGKQYTDKNQQISIRYLDAIDLTYKQNNLSLEFSELLYASEGFAQFVYQLKGFDNDWLLMDQKNNRLNYTNLEPGTYTLKVSKLNQYGKTSDISFTLLININPPWYYTTWAKVFYFLLILAVIAWVFNFFRVRNNLRIVRMEKEKTLELIDLKIEFFTNVSHELKTPLTLIIAPLSKLLLEIKDPWKKKQLESVHQNALRLNSLTRQLLDFNRDDNTNHTNMILSKIDIIEFSKTIFSVYEESNNRLNFHFKANTSHIITHVDVLKMESILNNLISNACKYSDDHATISLCIEETLENKQFSIKIQDDGVGIPTKELPYIFEKYYQSSKTKNQKEGTGIGLYLVKTYTEQHGGQLSIDSTENEGTTIGLTFPLVGELQGAVSDNEIINNQDSDLPTILIVEDNYEIASFIERILHPYYKCVIAHNGKSGLEMAQKEKPDLIVSDIMMPVMDGMEMSKLLRKNIPTLTIPIIILTAKDDKKTELDSLDVNIDAFISKPFDPLMLQSKIEQLLVSKQLLKEKIRLENIVIPQPIEAISPDEKFLSTLTQIIEDKISDPDLNVASLSEISGFGSKQVYRKLKQLTGKSPVEYIRYIRIQKAVMMLQQNKFAIAEVMYMVGFSSHSYFSKCFQKEQGKTPREFLDELTK